MKHGQPTSSAPVVELDGDTVHIRELRADGLFAQLVAEAAAKGEDLPALARRTLDVGAAVLLHGSALGTIDAVSAQVDRLLAVMEERQVGLARLGAMREQVSSAKGLDAQAGLAPWLEASFAPHEDEVEATGATRGIADDLCGDYVVTINRRDTGGRKRCIVFESKVRSRRAPTVSDALEELDRAMLNRSAQSAVMVYPKGSRSPLRGRPLRIYHGNRILVAFDPSIPGADLAFDVACQLARTLAMSAEREDLRLDRGMLAERLDKLTNIIEQGRDIKKGVSTARRGLDVAEAAYRKLAEEAMAVILEIGDRL